MADQKSNRSRMGGPLLVSLAALGMVALIFGGFIAVSSLKLRSDLRDRVVQRYADIWEPISKFHIEQGLEDEILQMLEIEDAIIFSLMAAQDIEGAHGIQIFDIEGRFLAGAPPDLEEADLDEASLSRLKEGVPWGVFNKGTIADGGTTGNSAEIVLNIPISEGLNEDSIYLARYFMDGAEATAEFATIDDRLIRQALVAFAGGTILISLVFLWSFWRLQKANREVAERAARLARANAELALVAKTSAVGAVASHLIHGLKNPLAGIREQLSSSGDGSLDSEDWEDAVAATGRMQSMINEVVDVLRNEDVDQLESMTGDEIANYLGAKFRNRASEKELDFGIQADEGVSLNARDANIAKLIVSNLLDNAIDALSSSGEVEARISRLDDNIAFSVIDTGPGFSELAKRQLFSPVKSQKAKGAGIGLAISQQLARHIGAHLELVRSSSSGSEIRLSIPATRSPGYTN